MAHNVNSILIIVTLISVVIMTEAIRLICIQIYMICIIYQHILYTYVVSGKAGSKQGRGGGNAGVKRAAEVLFQKDWENQTEASEPALSDTSAFPATTEASVRCASVHLPACLLHVCLPVCHMSVTRLPHVCHLSAACLLHVCVDTSCCLQHHH